MRITITAGDVVVPGLDAFLGGQTYEVTAEIGEMLVSRGQAVQASVGEVKNAKPEKKTR